MSNSLTAPQNHALLATFLPVQTKHESKCTQEYTRRRSNIIYVHNEIAAASATYSI